MHPDCEPLALGQQLLERLDAAAECSEPGPGVTRLFCSNEHRQVLEIIAEWMRRAGLTPQLDASATLSAVATRPGPEREP